MFFYYILLGVASTKNFRIAQSKISSLWTFSGWIRAGWRVAEVAASLGVGVAPYEEDPRRRLGDRRTDRPKRAGTGEVWNRGLSAQVRDYDTSLDVERHTAAQRRRGTVSCTLRCLYAQTKYPSVNTFALWTPQNVIFFPRSQMKAYLLTLWICSDLWTPLYCEHWFFRPMYVC